MSDTPPDRLFTAFSVAIALLIGIVVVGGFFLARALVDNWQLKQDAKEYAAQAGFDRAIRDSVRGKRQLLEVHLYDTASDDSGKSPDEGFDEPTGRREGVFEIRHFMVGKFYPVVHREVQAAYVEGYNRKMHNLHENPQWFDSNGLHRVKPVRASSKMNTEATTPPR